MNNQKPSFGATSNVVPIQNDRVEIGAVWSKISKANSEFLSIKLNLTKELLNQLAQTQEDVVSINLVAFPNKYKEGNPARPDFRIYEERKRI